MTKMSSEERQRRREKVAAEALESVAKSEQFNFRVDAETIKRLYTIASEQRKPVGALVREWILDRLREEEVAPSASELMKEMHQFRSETVACLRALTQNFAAMHTPQGSPPAMLAFLTESTTRNDLWQHKAPACGKLAETIPMPLPCPLPFPKMPEIPKAELFMVLNSLHPVKPGFYEVPDWLVEHFKDELQPK
ncbi:MAG: hypothetical protein HY986_11520 [Candidatus Melainabacteria bacterium]|nr:hypothetical protein [Candidatus Melainabacteria bacterium]